MLVKTTSEDLLKFKKAIVEAPDKGICELQDKEDKTAAYNARCRVEEAFAKLGIPNLIVAELPKSDLLNLAKQLEIPDQLLLMTVVSKDGINIWDLTASQLVFHGTNYYPVEIHCEERMPFVTRGVLALEIYVGVIQYCRTRFGKYYEFVLVK